MDNRFEFTKNDTNICKGIAISLMLFHHLFFSQSAYEGIEVNFYPLTQELVTKISIACKICVPIFVFLTAYGISLGILSKKREVINKEKLFSLALNRHIKLWFDYNIIYLIAVTLSVLSLNKSIFELYGKGKVFFIHFILDYLGLANLFNTPTLNETWWYIPLAYLLIYLVPVLTLMYRKIGNSLFVIVIVSMPYLNLDNNAYVFLYLPTAITGIACANYNLLGKFKKYSEGRGKSLISILILSCILMICIYYRQAIGSLVYIMNAAISLIICLLVCCIEHITITVGNILAFLGKHSMNIFLIHTLIKKYYLHEYIYSYNHFLLILCALIILSLGASIMIEFSKKCLKYDCIKEKTCEFLNSKLFILKENEGD